MNKKNDKSVGPASKFTKVEGLPNNTAILVHKQLQDKLALELKDIDDTLSRLVELSSGIMLLVPESGTWPWENE